MITLTGHEIRAAKAMKLKYRIQTSDGRIKYAGTGHDSWFTLERAREMVNRPEGERIIESDGVNILWEVF
jgi:flagellar basal body rod protein FlgG